MVNETIDGAAALRTVSDPVLLKGWVDACVASEPFWASTPRWAPSTERHHASDELVVWTEHSLFAANTTATALALHFDGALSFADLVEDVVAVLDLPLSAARQLVATVGVELWGRGAVSSVAVPDPPVPSGVGDEAGGNLHEPGGDFPPEIGECFKFDAATGTEHRVVTEVGPEGNLMSTEYLPDGRRIVTTIIAVGADSGGTWSEAQSISSDRSLAELVPIDSCLGSKLRNDDDVPLLTFRCADGRLRSVRCHHPGVTDALRKRAGNLLHWDGERGPVEAFVVTPLEGDGPVRIYDGEGRRRGRPRTVSQAVDVVDQILGERASGNPASDGGNLLTLPLQLVGRPDGGGVLVPWGVLDGPGAVAKLTQQGWTPTWGDAEVTGGVVLAPSAFGPPKVVADRPIVLLPGGDELTQAQRAVALLEPLAQAISADEGLSATIDRGRLIGLVVGLAEAWEWRPLTGGLEEHLLDVAATGPSSN